MQPGESLWAIAQHQLGPRASRGAVAAYVAKLWQRNAETINTGDPNLIYAGQQLHLPK